MPSLVEFGSVRGSKKEYFSMYYSIQYILIADSLLTGLRRAYLYTCIWSFTPAKDTLCQVWTNLVLYVILEKRMKN